MTWWRQHWRLGLALIVGGLGAIVVVILLLTRKSQEAERLRADLQVMKTTAKVAGLEAIKAARSKELVNNTLEAAKLDLQILEAKKDVVAVTKSVANLSDAQVLEAFKKLGY